MKRFIIALIGEKAAGKGAVATLLHQHHGARVMRFSDPIRAADILQRTTNKQPSTADITQLTVDLLQNNNTDGDLPLETIYSTYKISPPTGELLQGCGNLWRRKKGGGIFASILLDIIEELPQTLFVIDGMRNPAELVPLQKRYPNMHALLAIRADNSIRAQRFLIQRKRVGDPATQATFAAFDARDKGLREPHDGQQVQACLALVSEKNTLWNNRTPKDLEQNLQYWFDNSALFDILNQQD